MLTDVIGAAAGDGVKIGTILDAYRRLHKLERAPEFEAEATLAWLATQTELEADTLADAAAAAEAMAGGKLDEGNRALRGAREALSKVHTPPPQARAKTNRRAKRVGAQEGDAPRQGNAQSSQSIRPFRTPMPSAAIGPLHASCLHPAICTLQARKKHAELEMASSNVLLFSAPRPIDDFAAVDIALGDARQAGVDRGVGLRVGVKQVRHRFATAIEPMFSGWDLGDAFQLGSPASHSQP